MGIYLIDARDEDALKAVLGYAEMHENNHTGIKNPASTLNILIHEDEQITRFHKSADVYGKVYERLRELNYTETYILKSHDEKVYLYDIKKDTSNVMYTGVHTTKKEDFKMTFLGGKDITALDLDSEKHLSLFFNSVHKESLSIIPGEEDTWYSFVSHAKVLHFIDDSSSGYRKVDIDTKIHVTRYLDCQHANIPMTRQEETTLKLAIKQNQDQISPNHLLLDRCGKPTHSINSRNALIDLATAIAAGMDAFIIAERQSHLFHAISNQLQPKQWQLLWEAYLVINQRQEFDASNLSPQEKILIDTIKSVDAKDPQSLIDYATNTLAEHIKKHTFETPKKSHVKLDVKSTNKFFKEFKLSKEDNKSLFAQSARHSMQKVLKQYDDKSIDENVRVISLLKLAAYLRQTNPASHRSASPSGVSEIDKIEEEQSSAKKKSP
jgi:hypothetical protein